MEAKPKDLLIVRVPKETTNEELENLYTSVCEKVKDIYIPFLVVEDGNERKETTFEIVKY